MTPLLVIIGASGSGKSTLARELARAGYVRLLPTWTTRPPRADERGSGGCPEHCFVDEDEFGRLERSGFFLATGVLSGLGFRYGLPVPPTPYPGLVDAVIIRAAYVERLRAINGRPVLVYQVESDPETSRSRMAGRELPTAEVEARAVEARDEVEGGRRVADRVFVNSGNVRALASSVLEALRWDTAVYRQSPPMLPPSRPVWQKAPRSRWHWVGTGVACAVALAGVVVLSWMILVVVALSQMGSNK